MTSGIKASLIIGYNNKDNLGDDLMLNSNIRFLHGLGVTNIYILEWVLFTQKFTVSEKAIASHKVQLVKCPLTILGLLTLLKKFTFDKTFVIFGGGNIFDNKKIALVFYILIIFFSFSRSVCYLRGIGCGRKNAGVLNLITRFVKTRARDPVASNGKTVFKDTAYWSISRLNHKPNKIKYTYDAICFPRVIDKGRSLNNQVDRMVGYIEKKMNKVCLVYMDKQSIKEESNYALLIAKRITLKYPHIQVYIHEYKGVVDTYTKLKISKMCISERLHAAIMSLEGLGMETIVLPYSQKHILEFSGSRNNLLHISNDKIFENV
jgi:polysaccharide pyruvyl transferase WcaK-like protein